jgi:hypothetical protein
MIDTPKTKPGKTMGKEAKLSNNQRPGIFVFTTTQHTTADNSITMVAHATAIHKLFKSA